MISFSIQCFGCRVNQAEVFSWADEFQKHGMRYEDNFLNSDLIVVNTCTVTGRADRDVRNFLRRIKRENPKAEVIVAGCYVDSSLGELRGFSPDWKIFSNENKKNLTQDILKEIIPGKESLSPSYRSRAFIKIQDGCDFHCTFCIVPRVRGKSISVGKEKIFRQVRSALDHGYREIVLTGVHLCLYGKELGPEDSLLSLLIELEGFDGRGKIRLGSLDPRFLDKKILEHIVSSRKICPHFHLSLQHGSDPIIHRMGRKINASDYMEILKFLRQGSPEASLGADVIAGFPGESEHHFKEMVRFLEESPLNYFHVFSYSPRPETEAAKWPVVNPDIIKERASLLRKISSRKNLNFRRGFIGKSCEGIVIKKKGDSARILTSNYFDVRVPFCPDEERAETRVRITKVTEKEMTAESCHCEE
jgi:threonylcarbamoyladenosine tRNA methylthiotransferase MtaB